MDVSDRDELIQDVYRWFNFSHLPSPLREFSQQCHDLAANMIRDLPDSQQLLIGLQKLLEAKDCFVRATLSNGTVDVSALPHGDPRNPVIMEPDPS